MIEHRTVSIGNAEFDFIRMQLGNAPLLILKGRKGYVMCGYLDVTTADKVGDIAVRVSGVSTLEDVLKASVAQASSRASELGIEKGMPVTDVLQFLN
ncbi:MAG: DUF1805 domain-containing protein [Candidatus Thermoplasmatota archaeon]|jgi:uncharacterized protein YunC (DUF1805 family)|nr:DUF1805 domain-containing protein [Candidatus Thermoplasmatota archaeon]